MLRNLPFVGNYPVMMSFGDRPDLYGRVSHAGIPLRGHPGIDFALPEGTPVVAVQHGVVLDVRNDPQGYGLSVLLGHRWGQTFYGHLNEVRVQTGQQVGASQIVGLSGQTGLAEMPHLHFGLRLLPYSIGDGWCGFSDPMPYLVRLMEPKGAIIGPHIIGGIRPHLELLARWQPRLITVLDPNPDEIAALHEVCPNSIIVGRQFVPAHELEERIRTDPVTAATWAHETVRDRLSPHIHYWQIANEVLQDTDSLPLLNKFELARMRLAERAGYRCAILGFSVGNPDLPESDRLGAWRKLFPALERAEKKGHVVAVHQYGMPDLWGPNNAYDWYLLRLEHQVLRRLPFKRLKFAVTEFGIDGLIRGDQPAGWQTFTTPEGYVEQLLKCGRYLERFSGQVLGYTVFTLGHNAPWGTYDIAGKVATYLADLSEKGTWLEVDTQVFDISPRESDTDTDPGPVVIERHLAQEPPAPDEPAAAEVTGEEAAPAEPAEEQAAVEMVSAEEAGDQASREPVRQPEEQESADFEPDEEPALELEEERPAEEPSGPIAVEPTGEQETPPGEPAEAPILEPEKGEVEPPSLVEPGRTPALEVEADAPEAGPPGKPEPPPMEPATTGEEEPAEGQAPPDGEEPPVQEEPAKPRGPLVEQRIDEHFRRYNMTIKPIPSRPDNPGGDMVYLVKDVFMTFYGSWEPDGSPDAVPEWARADYLRPEFLEAGADHHLFAAIIGPDGEFIKSHEVLFWSDGFERLGDPTYNAYSRERTKETSGWANMFMAGGSSFWPESGESGPWCWAPAGAAEVVCGGGLPLGHPVSTFVVWQAVPRAEWEETLGEQPETGEPTEPAKPAPPTPTVETRISEWAPLYNITIKSISARPDYPTGDIIYLVRDVFTTRNGSWEPIALPGSVPQWARDEYLKPANSPDYFDDAGGDHHLFAAVIGLDGKLVRQQEIIYWSDGFERLGDPEYNGYVRRFTKERSGWANIITGPGSSYVPERGESGPWCWAPAGAAEVVCGGGLPANHHISLFVVWQAVANPESGQPDSEDDHNIFLPIVTGAPAIAGRGTAAPPVEMSSAALHLLRQAAWMRLNVEYRPDSILGAYARKAGLGRPVTQEFEVGNMRAQGFEGGIVFAEGNRVSHISW